MNLSSNARPIVEALAKTQGLRRMEFNDDGLMPIRLGGDVQIALGYSTANDSFFLFGVLDPRGETGHYKAWWAFEETLRLSERRTRIALEPASGALVIVAEIFAKALEFYQFEGAMEAFIRDFDDLLKQLDRTASVHAKTDETSALPPSTAEDLIVFRL